MGYKIAVLGATGAVGREMINVLEEYQIPVDELKLLASARSAGQTIPFAGKDVAVEEAKEDSFEGMDFVLGAVQNPMAVKFAPHIVKSGAVFIDNSSAFRQDPDVPLVVPEINGSDAFTHKGIIANPNCSTIITMVAVGALAKISPIETMVASTYQAVSGAGQPGLEELSRQLDDLHEGRTPEVKTFPAQIALNVIPYIGSYKDNGYTTEEMKMQNEGRKILHLPGLRVTCTCVRVPVMRSHSVSLLVRTRDRITVEQARELIAAAPGCRLVDDLASKVYPMPLDTSDQDLVFVGRIRPDLIDEKGLNIWCCGDQVRKGAATNAVQIAELVTKL